MPFSLNDLVSISLGALELLGATFVCIVILLIVGGLAYLLLEFTVNRIEGVIQVIQRRRGHEKEVR